MDTPNDGRIGGEDKKVSLSIPNPGGPRSNLRDENTHCDNNKIKLFSDQTPGIAPKPKNEQDENIFGTSEAGLTALVPLASITASALQTPPRSAREPKYKRQRLQANVESPRKELVAKRVVSLAELHRRRGLTLFQFFWEQGMACGQSCSAVIVCFLRYQNLTENAVPPDDHPFWHNDKDDFEPYEYFWAPSRGPQWDDPMWHNDYDEETYESFFNLNPGGPKPCFWNEDGSFSERVFRLFFDSIPGVATSSRDAEYIAAITGVASAGSQSYNAWPPSAVPAIRKQNQYRSRRGGFNLLQNEGMPFPKLVNRKVPIEELHRRRSLSLLQFFQEMGMPSS